MTIKQIVAAIAPRFAGRVLTCTVTEHMGGVWTIEATIQPSRAYRPIRIFDTGESRPNAVLRFIQGAPEWAKAYNCTTPNPQEQAHV